MSNNLETESSNDSDSDSTESDSDDDGIMQSVKLNQADKCQRKLIEEVSSGEIK